MVQWFTIPSSTLHLERVNLEEKNHKHGDI